MQSVVGARPAGALWDKWKFHSALQRNEEGLQNAHKAGGGGRILEAPVYKADGLHNDNYA